MTKNLFDTFAKMTVGFDNMLNDIDISVPSYPVYNIKKITDNDEEIYVLEIALTGFKKEEVNVSLSSSGELAIHAQKLKETKRDNEKYIHKGIAQRSFTRKYSIMPNFEVEEAKMEDGILSIKFVSKPDDKSSTIEIK